MHEEALLELIPRLCMSLGINKSVVSAQDGSQIISHMPVSARPYAMTHHNWSRLRKAHQIWQKLIVRVGADEVLMSRIASSLARKDEFMSKIVAIYKKTHEKGESVGVACSRIDYMGDEDPQLVEYNLMSVGLNGVADKVQQLASIIRTSPNPCFYPLFANQSTICEALLTAEKENGNSDGITVMVCHTPEFNFGDQNYFKLEMMKRGKIVVSLTMEQLLSEMKYEQESGSCWYQSSRISSFYFRTGYRPEHFPNEEYWQLREQIQLSNAIKLPSVEMLIVNTKRMQAELAKPSVLQKFLEPSEVKELVGLSGEIYDFDGIEPDSLAILIQKMEQGGYVLKPNREGGGNNFFGKQAYEKICVLRTDPDELRNFIVMKSIDCRKENNVFILDYSHREISEATAEISTFGCFVYKGTELMQNQQSGFLIRLKEASDLEGGIAINKAALAGLCIRLE